MAEYAPNVHDGVSNPIIGRKVRPTMKLQPQLVAVEIDDPRDRTLSGNNSDCCPVRDKVSSFVRLQQERRTYMVQDPIQWRMSKRRGLVR
jgi:hypothetical protein